MGKLCIKPVSRQFKFLCDPAWPQDEEVETGEDVEDEQDQK